MNDHVYRIRDEIAWRKMKDGTVTIVSPLVEKIISINATAGIIWELLDGKRNVAAVVDGLYEKFGGSDGVDRATLERDTHEMLRDLIDRQLVEQIVDNTNR
ncbi:MAG TPA: PqqD family protein [bacterium]|nr:PqqD family protein [bacterium]